MRRQRIAVVCSMQDEVDVVNWNLSRLEHTAKDFYICRSSRKRKSHFDDMEIPDRFKDDTHLFTKPVLKFKTSSETLTLQPAKRVTRDYAELFSRTASRTDIDWVLAITGTTKMWHMMGIFNTIQGMIENDCIVACNKAIGQVFHPSSASLSDVVAPRRGKIKNGIKQTSESMEIVSQLVVVKASEVRNGLFCKIPVTNKWSVEQCLGDAYAAHGLPVERQFAMSQEAHGFTMGIRYNVPENPA